MILKTLTKALYFLDRDTDIDPLVDEIMRAKRADITVFLQRQKERLQEKEAGEYFTLEDILRVKEGELENMNRFFRGAVVPYYTMQSRNIWGETPSSKLLAECTEEIKREVGFMKYDHTGHITDEVNSMTTFERVKDLNDFLHTIKEVCFNDQGYIFPDSKHFKELVKAKGREAAQRQVLQELYQEYKNRLPGGVINYEKIKSGHGRPEFANAPWS